MSDSDHRAVSEVVGFVFVFSIVILSIVLVSVTGYAGLEQSREAERVNNAERGLDLLADNVDDVTRGGVPSRSTELRVAGGDVTLGDPVVVSVSGHPVDDPSTTTVDAQYEIRPIVYDDGDGTQLAYTLGAVTRTDPGGSVLLREPDLVVSGNETVLVVARPEPVDTVGVGGATNVHLRVTGDDPVLAVAEPAPHVLTISVTSPDVEAWRRYFADLAAADDAVSCLPPSGDTVTCTVTTDRTYVTVVDVAVRFD
jgi:hypothetical protein